jgi:prepilin-type N-terminal cleavage/methylation domain-containing protein
MRRAGRGFSLAELMITIAIITFLMAIILPSLQRSRSEAQLAACVENLKSMGTAYQSWLADNPGVKDMAAHSDVFSNLVPRYLAKVPVCPSSGASLPKFGGGGSVTGYVWVWYEYVDSEPFPYVMCLGSHDDLLPASRGLYNGPVWSPRSGIDDCRSGHPRY